MTVEIHSVEWGMLLGQTLPGRILDSIRLIDGVEEETALKNIKIGDERVFETLQREWYIHKGMLFISEEIATAELNFAIQSWIHELDLIRIQQIEG